MIIVFYFMVECHDNTLFKCCVCCLFPLCAKAYTPHLLTIVIASCSNFTALHDTNMKLGEDGQFHTLKMIGCRHKLKNAPLCYFQTGVLGPSPLQGFPVSKIEKESLASHLPSKLRGGRVRELLVWKNLSSLYNMFAIKEF